MLNVILKQNFLNILSKKNLNNIYIYNFITFLPEDFLFNRLNFDFLFPDPQKFSLLKYTNICLFQNLAFFGHPLEDNETEKNNQISNMYKKIFGYNFYVSFFLNFIEFKFKKKVFFKIINIYKYFYRFNVYSLYRYAHKRLGYYKFKVRKYFNFLETFKILYMSILFKDAALFMNWFTKIMSRIQYRSTKQFLYFLKTFLLRYLLPAIGEKSDLLGFFF